jgi:GTPase SAR1 family protein
MGGCQSKKAVDGDEKDRPDIERKRDKRDKKYGKDLEKQKSDEAKTRVLLLGPGESGKSTLVKQLVHLYGTGYDTKKRLWLKPTICADTVISMKSLVRWSPKLDGCHYSEDLEPDAKAMRDFPSDVTEISEVVARHIKRLWADPGIQRTYTLRSKFQILDECKWFFERIDELAKKDYLPSWEDFLHCRGKTPGITTDDISLEGLTFSMMDVGGQRNERKKWLQCAENVTAIVFVAALNEYDQLLYEDSMTNRLHETLNLFATICSSKWFQRATLILFLNKDDLFREKIKRVDLKAWFPEYDGGCNYDNAMTFLRQEFDARNEHRAKRKVYSHVTCAIVEQSVRATFASVKEVIVGAASFQEGLS